MPLDEFPRDWGIDEEYHSLYDQLKDKRQSLSPFRGKEFADVFAFVMALGFYHKTRSSLKKRSGSIPYSALLKYEWLIKAVAVSETGTLRVLLDKTEVARIAEEYANGGMMYLKEIVFGGEPGDAHKRLEFQIRRIVRSLENGEQVSAPTARDDSMELINKLELRLRSLISKKLSAISSNWTKERIPSSNSMVSSWKERMVQAAKAEDLFIKDKSQLIDFSEIGELFEIVKWNRNWSEVFHNCFKDKSVFEADMKQLIMIRRNKAHSRQLNDIEKEKLRAIVAHMLALIDKYEKEEPER